MKRTKNSVSISFRIPVEANAFIEKLIAENPDLNLAQVGRFAICDLLLQQPDQIECLKALTKKTA